MSAHSCRSGAGIEVIAEWGQSCRGHLGDAIEQAEMAQAAGCTWSKWQMLDPARLAAADAPAYWSHAAPGDQQQAVFEKNGLLAPADWVELKAVCDELGIGFLVTPFDLEAVDALVELDAQAFKIASGDITYRALLECVAATGRPVFLSTGAATQGEISRALGWLHGCPVTLLACDLVYPCPDDQANLARIDELGRVFGHPVGYSDHTLSADTALAAAGAGAVVLEKHCTLDPEGEVPDDAMGLVPTELVHYVSLANMGAQLRGDRSISPSVGETAARYGARRSLHLARPVTAGQILEAADLVALRPCPPGSYQPWQLPHVVGGRLTVSCQVGHRLSPADLM